MSEKIICINKDVVGIGKMRMYISTVSYDIPRLSFYILKDSHEYFAHCIQVPIKGKGKTPERAMGNLKKNCVSFFTNIFPHGGDETEGWTEFSQAFRESVNHIKERKIYRDVQLLLAKEDMNCEIIEEKMIKEYEKRIRILKRIQRKAEKGESLFECHVIKYRRNPMYGKQSNEEAN